MMAALSPRVTKTLRPYFGWVCALISCVLVIGACSKDSTGPGDDTPNQSPTASFSFNCTGLDCSFDGSASADSDGSVSSYAWAFGDGASGTGATASHSYGAAGSFNVVLTVTDNDGATGVTTRQVGVTAANQSPTASFTVTCTNLDCSFDGTGSTDPDGTIQSYAWAFGDGASGTGATVMHTYAAGGAFTVALTVTDNGGASANTSRQATPMAAATGQIGSTIVGEAVGDQFGRAVAISDDGRRIVAGAPTNGGAFPQAGQVRVFEWDGSAWTQLGADIDGPSAFQLLGEENTIDISGDGNRIAIGHDRANGNGGTVRVYEYAAGAWTQVGSTISGLTGRQLGYSVALSTTGDRVAVGVPGAGTVGNAEGAVRVFALSGSSWSQMGSDIMGEAPGDRSGVSVDLSGSGNRVAVGAQGNDDGGSSNAGQVRVHEWNGSAWMQVGQDMDGNGNGSNELFGMAVSISRDGTRVAGWGAQSGDYAKVFELVGSNWVQMGPDFSVPAAFNLHMPISLSANGSRIAIGRPFAGTNTNGTLTLYDWTGSAWVQAGTEIMGDQPLDNLGWAVALSADGRTVAAGLRGYMGGSLQGAVRVYAVP